MIDSSIEDKYYHILETYLSDPREDHLVSAAKLGRELVMTDVPPEEIVELYKITIQRLAQKLPDTKLIDTVDVITTPLMELFMAYGLAFRERLEHRKQIEEKLRVSEEKYRILTEAAEDAIFIINRDDEIEFVNTYAANQLGLKAEDLIGKPRSEMFPPDISRNQYKTLKKVFESGESLSEESKVLNVESERWLNTRLVPLKDDNGETRAVLGITLDITERKRAEEALHNITEGVSGVTGELFLESLVQHLTYTLGVRFALVGELMEDEKGEQIKTIAMSDRNKIVKNITYDLAGTPCEKVAGKKLCCYFKDVQNKFPEDPLLAEKKVESYCGVPLFDSVQKALGVLVIMDSKPMENREIIEFTLQVFAVRVSAELERKKAEEALRESEARYSALSQSTNEGIAIHEKGNILDANQTFADMFAYELQEVIGMNALDFTAPESRELVEQNIVTQYEKPYEAIGLRKDGSTFIGEVCGKSIPYHGKTVRVTVIRDITEHKLAEGELRKKIEQLDRANRLMVGRELKMIQLKKEVNTLLENAGLPKKYSAPDEVQ